VKSEIKIGIIGAGVIAQEHAVAIRQLGDDATLTAIADVDAGRTSAFAGRFGVPQQFSGAEELIEKGGVDLVVVATPPAFHEGPVVEALAAGKHVLCEKPIAHTLAVARKLCELGKRYPNRLSVGHQMRYSAEFERLKWLCANGKIGKLNLAVLERHGRIPAAHAGGSSWWGKWEVAGGGVLLTQMIHEIDLLIEVFGPPVAVTASMDTRFTGIESEDMFEAEVEFSDGRTAICRGSVNSGESGGGFRVVGRAGEVALPATLILGTEAAERAALSAVNNALPQMRPQSTRLMSRFARRAMRKFGIGERPEINPHVELYRRIVAAIRTGGSMPVPPESALWALELCMGVYESALVGMRVELPLSEDAAVYSGLTPTQYKGRISKNVIASTNGIPENVVKIGLIGLDTSHAPTFTGLLNNPAAANHLSGTRVVAGFSGGSDDMEISSSRVGAFTQQLEHEYGVAINNDPAEVAKAVDLVLLTASDGRKHVELLETVAPAGKPVFVDKPFAVSVADAKRMYEIADAHNIQLVGCSAFRYADGLVSALHQIKARGEKIRECEVSIWLPVQETQGRYFWYGIHASEMLVAAMGAGVARVAAQTEGDADTIRVEYGDGRCGTLIGSQKDDGYRVRIVTDRDTYDIDLAASLGTLAPGLLWGMIDVMTKGDAPRLWRASTKAAIPGERPSRLVDPDREQTLEVVRILDLAQQSLARGGDWVAA
jgi:predicted dehydrogenase